MEDRSSKLNMCSACLHVAADTLRSTTTLVEALYILYFNEHHYNTRLLDAYATLVVSSIVVAGILRAHCTHELQATR